MPLVPDSGPDFREARFWIATVPDDVWQLKPVAVTADVSEVTVGQFTAPIASFGPTVTRGKSYCTLIAPRFDRCLTGADSTPIVVVQVRPCRFTWQHLRLMVPGGGIYSHRSQGPRENTTDIGRVHALTQV